MIDEMRQIAEGLPLQPASVVIFGSFARGQAVGESDIDTLLVRPLGIDEIDERWSSTVQQWIDHMETTSGNSVEVLEVGEADIPARLSSKRSVWQEIRRDGLVVRGLSLESLQIVTHE